MQRRRCCAHIAFSRTRPDSSRYQWMPLIPLRDTFLSSSLLLPVSFQTNHPFSMQNSIQQRAISSSPMRHQKPTCSSPSLFNITQIALADPAVPFPKLIPNVSRLLPPFRLNDQVRSRRHRYLVHAVPLRPDRARALHHRDQLVREAHREAALTAARVPPLAGRL